MTDSSTRCRLRPGPTPWILALLLVCNAAGAERLYETGPAEDAAFVRFIQTLDGPLMITAGKGRLSAAPPQQATAWQPIPPGRPQSATLESGGASVPVQVTAAPGEMVSVLAVGSPVKGKWTALRIAETPTDFSSTRVALGLLNAAPSCSEASLRLASRNAVSVIGPVATASIVRRLLNPAKGLQIEIWCKDKPIVRGHALPDLQAGDRWTLVLHSAPGSSTGFEVLAIQDQLP